VGGLAHDEVAALYEAYGHLVRRRCGLTLRDAALADDALQEVFLKALRYGSEVKSAASPLAWLYRVADNCCYTLRKKITAPSPPPAAEPSWHPVHHLEARNGVLAALAGLPERDVRVAMLAFVDGLSQGEIADEVGSSRQTVNRKLQEIRERALVRLRGDDD